MEEGDPIRLAISNLAWPVEADAAVAGILKRCGVLGVELAPTKVWPKPLEASESAAREYRGRWEQLGLRVVALQAILFGRPDLTLFESDEKRAETLAYLAGMCRLAGWLGTEVLVFGSPKNRLVGAMSPAVAESVAGEFFRRVGESAAEYGTAVCIEPNPVEYGCDFVTRAVDGVRLVERVNHPGFGLHFDAGGMALSGDPPELLTRHGRMLRHFHISEPHMQPIGRARVDHAGLAAALRAGGYERSVSIEMKPVPDVAPEEAVESAVRLAQELYQLD
jgi:sugar phosphate isomerase/epimerase